jgi:type I restriction enzyme, S subunit
MTELKSVRTKSISKIVQGSTPDSSNPDYWNGEITWVTPADLGGLDSYVIQQSERLITEAGLNNCGTKLCPAGSLIVSTRAPIGHMGITTLATCTNQGCKTLIPKSNVDVRFLYYALYVKKSELNSLGSGSTFMELSADSLGTVRVSLPEKKQQNLIADFLDRETAKIDRLIEEKERLLQVLDERRQALITQAVTRGLDSSVPMKDSGRPWLGDIPAHWSVCPIKSICSINDDVLDEKTDEDFEFRYIDIGSVNSRGQVLTVETLKFGSAPSRARRQLRQGDIIVSTVRTYLKAIAFIESEHSNSVASTGFAVLRAKDIVAPEFLGSLVRTNYFVSEVVSRSVGVSYPAITSSEIGSIKVPLPPREEQDQISDHVSRINNGVNCQEEILKLTISKLKDRRSSLINEAVTGQLSIG